MFDFEVGFLLVLEWVVLFSMIGMVVMIGFVIVM